ncbi:MAG: ABC transporter substrate-binding protein [Anaerolineales bacterium]|jgi:multiple sugar transport system substrate-binding protein
MAKKILVLILTSVLLLTACAPQTVEVVKTVEVEVPVEVEKEVIVEVDKSPISVTIPWTGDAMELFLPVVDAFEAETGIQVTVLPYKTEDLGPLLPAQFMAQEPMADVFIMSWPWWIEENAEHLEDLSDIAAGVDWLGNPVVVDGKTYGIPTYLFVKGGFWYFQSFFDANGLEKPETWDDFYALLDQIREIDGIEAPMSSPAGYPLADIVEHFLQAVGGPEMVQGLMDGTVKWTDPEVRAVFSDYLIPLIDQGYFSDPVERHAAADLWIEGDYALHYYGNWIAEDVDDPADLRILPVPGSTAIVSGTDWMFIPKYTTRMDDAKKFVEFVISEAGMRPRLELGGRLSSRADISLDVYPPNERNLAEAVSTFTVLPDLDDTIGGEWQTIFWDQISLLWVDTGSLDEVLDTLQANMPE